MDGFFLWEESGYPGVALSTAERKAVIVRMEWTGKELAVWGSGNIGMQVMNAGREISPVYFIDNDAQKCGKTLCGRKIIHPSQISDWQGIFVLVALDHYAPVRKQLMQAGLKEGEDFLWYREWLFEKKEGELLEEEERFLQNVRETERYMGSKLIFSDFLAFDKGVCAFVNRWKEREPNLVLCSEAGWLSGTAAKKKLEIPVVELPDLLSHNQYLKKNDAGTGNREKEEYVQSKTYLSEAALNLRLGYPDMAEKYEYTVCFCADRVIREIIRCWKPSQIILWNAFYAFHFIIRHVCMEKGVSVKYMEFGNIPGTIVVEGTGQMGESYPARYPQEFLELPVSEAEYAGAERLIRDLRIQRLNRNVQPRNDLQAAVRGKMAEGKPVIFYAGQNDNASGMQPYTENTRKFHSPVFTSSDEAAVYLARLCREMGWNFIYKPHPMMAAWCCIGTLPGNAAVVDQVDINDLIDFSDVVVTVLSTVSYIALIREKPVVMLGYTQLKGKGCTYEAFREEIIGEQIRNALENGAKDLWKRKHHFAVHTAQMQKYYGNPYRQGESAELG